MSSRNRRQALSEKLRNYVSRTAGDGAFCYLGGTAGGKPAVMAWPVADPPKNVKKTLLSLYVSVHSRLVSWWLTNAWRSDQLAHATWKLGDSEQLIAAAACARSLLETAAAFWVDSRKLIELWRAVKVEAAEKGPKVEHWDDLTRQIFKMMWSSKFDNKVPEFAKLSESLSRTNVLGLIEKLQRATSVPIWQDYEWLCNAVHPSIGTMLAYATPMLWHKTGTHGFQYVAPFATHIVGSGGIHAETTIDEAIARSAVLSVAVVRQTLDATLRIIDDVALTTGAPVMASFKYWRMLSQKSRNTLCPCRSGRKVKNCRHGWKEQLPSQIDLSSFDAGLK